jgi:hypothetical protein
LAADAVVTGAFAAGAFTGGVVAGTVGADFSDAIWNLQTHDTHKTSTGGELDARRPQSRG